MPELSVAYIVENENNALFKASLQSVLPIADEVIIIDGGSTDGTLELIDSFHTKKIKVIHKRYLHEWKSADGAQRNEYLKWVTKEWVLVLDADEVLSDNGFLLKELGPSKGCNAYDVQMVHFIGNLDCIDATVPVHFVPRRFFRNKPGLKYPEVEHTILTECEPIGAINEVIIYHYGYTKGIWNILKKYHNHVKKSNMHPKEFLKWWKDAHLHGTYPVAPFVGEHPQPIKELIQ